MSAHDVHTGAAWRSLYARVFNAARRSPQAQRLGVGAGCERRGTVAGGWMSGHARVFADALGRRVAGLHCVRWLAPCAASSRALEGRLPRAAIAHPFCHIAGVSAWLERLSLLPLSFLGLWGNL